jgi:hypothetical protein
MARSEVDGEGRPQRSERGWRLAAGIVEEIPEPLGGGRTAVERPLGGVSMAVHGSSGSQ